MAKISRKYDTLMKFLRETIANEKLSIRTRMSAAERLDGIFARHEAAAEKETIRQERTEARKIEARKETPIPAEVAGECVDELGRSQPIVMRSALLDAYDLMVKHRARL